MLQKLLLKKVFQLILTKLLKKYNLDKIKDYVEKDNILDKKVRQLEMSLRISDIKFLLKGAFQKVIKNLVSLGDDSTLETDLKPLKIGGKNTPIQISETEVKINGSPIITEASDVDSLNDLSDVTYSSGDLTITDLDTIISGGLTIDSSADITLDSDGADTVFKDDGTKFATISSMLNAGHLTLFSTTDNNDKLVIATGTNGAASITTTASPDATSAHLSFSINGDWGVGAEGAVSLACGGSITLRSNSGSIIIDNGGTTFGTIVTSVAGKFQIVGADDYQVNIVSGGTGDINVTSADNITIDAADTLNIDTDGTFAMKQDGTEYSVANSAYAGMILGYRMIGEDARTVTYTISSSWEVMDADCTVRFIAPPSGAVEVFVQAGLLDAQSGRNIFFGLSDNATYNTVGNTYSQLVNYTDETDQQVIQHHWTITGLTAGTTYNYWFAANASSGTNYIYYGGDREFEHPDFIMKVTALPTAVSDFAEYD